VEYTSALVELKAADAVAKLADQGRLPIAAGRLGLRLVYDDAENVVP